tara:strand:+ start:2249 stop:2407 length:159 start_codon:yes stop_codon:yes gene_type:complete
MKAELELVEDKSMLMREYLPMRQHRSWKKTYLNKTVYEVLLDINDYQRRNKQ